MAPVYRGMSRTRRMEIAVKRVVEDKLTQAEAARQCGVSRPRLNQNVKEAQGRLDGMAERSAAAMAARREITLASAGAHFSAVTVLPGLEVRPGSTDGVRGPEPTVDEQPLVRVSNERTRVPDFEEFDRIYFGNLVCPDCGVHHPTPGFHSEIMRAVDGPGRLMINLPPYHSKSTIVTVKSTIHALCKDPNSRTAIISKTQRMAQRFLHSISTYLTNPHLYEGAERNLLDDFGPFYSPSSEWNKTQLYIAGRNTSEKDPTVAAYGVGGHIYGTRWDRMIYDDIADLENQKNPELVKEQLQWCTQEAGNRVGVNGLQVYVGTRVGAGDIYSALQQLPGFKVLRYPCILDEDDRTTLWSDHFPFSAAESQRDTMTPDSWQLVYQNVDTPGAGASFPPDVLEQCHSIEHVLGAVDSNWALVAGLDPAGGGKQAGYTAMTLLAVDLTSGQRHLVDLMRAKAMKAPQLKEQIFAWADEYPQMREFRVEVNGLQSQLVQYNQEILSHLTNRGVRVVPHVTTGHNKWDSQFGVESLAPMFYNRQITLPWGNDATRKKVRLLEEELSAFPMGATSDLVMSLWFAELGAREMFKRTSLPMFNERMRVPAHIRSRRRIVDFATRTVSSPSDREYGGRPSGMLGQGGTPQRMVNVTGEVLVY